MHCDNFDNPDYPGLSVSKYEHKNAVAEVDMYIGHIVKALEEAGILENTFIFVTSDNGPQMDAWPDARVTQFRGEKMTTWEVGVRVPLLESWPGHIPFGEYRKGTSSLEDIRPTPMSASGDNDIIEKLKS